MPDLIAQGADPRHRWRRTLIPHIPLVLGRVGGSWDVPWDAQISRRHAQLLWNGDFLQVTRLEQARNPLFFRGRQQHTFPVRTGEHFVIGGTTFSISDEQVNVTIDSPPAANEQAFSPAYLQSVSYRDADQRIEVLSRLPEVISGATNDKELFVRLISLLLTGIARATAAAIVAVRQEPVGDAPIEILHWDRRSNDGGSFSPSGRLIRNAVESGKSVASIWNRTHPRTTSTFVDQEDVDWAFCTPVLGEACPGWALYLTGRFDPHVRHTAHNRGPEELQDELKFAELAATVLHNLREVRLLEHRQSSLRPFFSPVVLEALAGQDPNEVLAPREAEVSVLFCDLRGFSRRSEQDAGDLLGLLNRVSRALGVMTRCILEQGGVVGDFHGDAAMGFWGWPIEQPDSVERACRAALRIRDAFDEAARHTEHPLTDFRVGIGVATGPAVAGKIGTVDQVKVTVFGPVVNLASRLETMTKVLRAPLLIDEVTARYVRGQVPPSVARVRRVATVRPSGMDSAVEVSELLPPVATFPQLNDQHIAAYERALDALQARDWETAFQWLHQVPAEDRVKDYLTVFIAQHNRMPPPNWDGAIPIATK
ncbi:MAG: adenylate/guanylate cyclase domain-containing protein [Pirellulaceae bacterium]